MIEYTKGDIFSYVKNEVAEGTIAESPILIVHCCNNVGAWGRGFVVALSEFDPRPERAYREWAEARRGVMVNTMGELRPRYVLPLGKAQAVVLERHEEKPALVVGNIIGQHDIGRKSVRPPVRYDAIHSGLVSLYESIIHENREREWRLWLPKMGSGLAGGEWEYIEAILLMTRHSFKSEVDVSIRVFDL